MQHRFSRSSRRCSVKKVVLNISQNWQENLYQSLIFNKVAGLRPQACNLIKKETLVQVFTREFCEIYKNTFFYRMHPVAVSVLYSWGIHSFLLTWNCFFFMTYSRWLDDLCPTWYIGNFVQEWKGLISTYFSLIFLFFHSCQTLGEPFLRRLLFGTWKNFTNLQVSVL